MKKNIVKILCFFIPFRDLRHSVRNKLLDERFNLWYLLSSLFSFNLKDKFENKIKIFVAGSGAVTEYAIKMYQEMPDKFVIFADVRTSKEYKNLLKKFPKASEMIFPLCKNKKYIYDNSLKLFYVGNSSHYSFIFKILLKTKNVKNRWLVLPDIVTLGAYTYNIKEIRKIICNYYPEFRDDIKNVEDKDFVQFICINKISFIRYVVEASGIKNFVVFSKKGFNTIKTELKNVSDINIYVMQNTISKLSLPQSKYSVKHSSKYLVGTFGIPHDITKGTDKVIKAVQLLNKRGKSVDLVLAGMLINNYIDSVKDKKNCIFIDNPDYDDFLNIMNQCDVGIQLRENFFTFASGCMAELLGLGKPTILTDGMIDNKWDKIVTFVPDGVSVEELADTIVNMLETKVGNKIEDKLYEEYNCFNVCSQLYAFLEEKNIGD